MIISVFLKAEFQETFYSTVKANMLITYADQNERENSSTLLSLGGKAKTMRKYYYKTKQALFLLEEKIILLLTPCFNF